MTNTVASIAEAAQDLLDVSVTALATTDAGFAGLSWLNPGMPAFDVQCDFVTVWQSNENLAASGLIPASQLHRTGPRIMLSTLNVTTGRCLAVGNGQKPPSVEQKTADAVKHMQDAQALWNGVEDALADGSLFSFCSQVTLQGMTAYTPQGGMGGWNLTVVAQIDGY